VLESIFFISFFNYSQALHIPSFKIFSSHSPCPTDHFTPTSLKNTMQFTRALAVLVASFLFDTVAAQTTHSVVVGESGLTFTPSQVTAAVGDIVSFEFHPKNHTLTQSTFASPCTAMAGGVNSGFMPVAANATTFPVYSFKVNQVTPLWFFCAQTGHCQQGMVMAINVNATSPNSFAAYLANATGSSSNSTSTSSSGSTTGYGNVPSASGMVTMSAPAASASSTGTAAPGAAASGAGRSAAMVSSLALIAAVASALWLDL